MQAGWRVLVITPLLKSGAYRLDPKADREQTRVTGSGNKLSVTMSAGSDFLGYEKSYYAVEARDGGGVRVRFSSAETVQDGKTAPQKRPVVALFGVPRMTRHVRLVYLLRRSKADHDMAILGAREPAELRSLTLEVQADPARGCRSRPGRFCQWIPAGIAVRAELRRQSSGDWVPAR